MVIMYIYLREMVIIYLGILEARWQWLMEAGRIWEFIRRWGMLPLEFWRALASCVTRHSSPVQFVSRDISHAIPVDNFSSVSRRLCEPNGHFF